MTNEKNDIMISPFFMCVVESFLEKSFSILQSISLPNVIALIWLNESTVDIIIAIKPVINSPKNPFGRTPDAKRGNVNKAWFVEISPIA